MIATRSCFRFAKAGGLPWLALLDEIYPSVADE
jgi:hypothetical protein